MGSLHIPLILSVLTSITLTIVLLISFNSETAHLAQTQAKKQLGRGYQYYVNSLKVKYSSQDKFVTATVIAYNNHEIRTVPVQWSETTTTTSPIKRHYPKRHHPIQD